jgi:hypothetical protein
VNVISTLLDRVAEARAKVAEVQAEIEAVAGDLLKLKARFETEVKDLEAQAKNQARFIPISQRHTLHGSTLQLVWTVRRDFEESDLQALASKYGITPAELDACKTDKGYWSVRQYKGTGH